jgi:hypothetical protein
VYLKSRIHNSPRIGVNFFYLFFSNEENKKQNEKHFELSTNKKYGLIYITIFFEPLWTALIMFHVDQKNLVQLKIFSALTKFICCLGSFLREKKKRKKIKEKLTQMVGVAGKQGGSE